MSGGLTAEGARERDQCVVLPTENRMRRSNQFAAAVRNGRRAGRRTVVGHLAVDLHDGPPQVGFVVSRKVGGAVVRNHVRRRLRHVMQRHLGALRPGTLLVLRALPASAESSSGDLARDLETLLPKLTRTESS